MPLEHSQDTLTFETDHRPVFSASYWDTVYTPESAGVEFSIFTLTNGVGFESVVGGTPQAVARATMEAQLQSGNMESVLGYSGADYITGVTPNVYHYWGSGAPPGVTKAKAAVLKFRGDVKEAGETTLVFAGQGRVQVYVNGTEILNGEIAEPITFPNITTAAQFQNEAGYLMVNHTFVQGDDLEIYYWHNGEPWGGIAVKAIPGDQISNYDPTTIRSQLRDAAVLGASFFGIEAAGADLASSEIPYIISASVTKDRDAATTGKVVVALTTSDQPDGFSWSSAQNALVDNDTGLVIKEGRRILIQAGYADIASTKDANGDITAEIYPRLTGHITKLQPDEGMATAVITVKGFEDQLFETFDENFPDRLTYLANGYIFREGSYEPVYNIPAFDNWPIETAIAEYCYRSGIDAKYLGKNAYTTDPTFSRNALRTATTDESRNLRKLFGARYLADSTKLVRIERNSAYGNVGVLKKDYLPDDDEYLFTPEITDRCFDKATEIAEHYGYTLLFDSLGRVYIRGGGNPDEFIPAVDATYSSTQISVAHTGIDTTEPTTDIQVSPEAITGQYIEVLNSDPTWSIEVTGYFSRLDLYTGIGTDGTYNGGVVDYVIEVWNGVGWDAYDTGSVSTFRALAGNETENLSFYYDGVLNDDGSNAAVFEIANLPFDRYRVTFSDGGIDPSDGGGDAAYRINGVAAYYLDPHANMYPVQFATNTNVFSMLPQSGKEDLRNHIIIVGNRKGVVTDSAKFSGEDTNPANQEAEFHVEVASDPGSIYNPTSDNFRGKKKIAVIYDDKVSDSDFARWLALTALYRYRNPDHKVPVNTIAVPMLEVGDSISVYEARHQMVNRVVWVQRFTEEWKANEASVEISTSSFPEIPAYQPREDLDIDTLYNGNPAINVEISYTNLMGTPVSNADLDDPHVFIAPSASEAMSSVVSQALTNPAIPETIILRAASSNINVRQARALVNHPYRHFWHISSWGVSNNPTLTFDIQEGDGSDVYTSTYYQMPNTSPLTWFINYNYLGVRSTENPFYDPYSSELGYLVSVKFDALISGRYRVSVWDANKSGGVETPIAWLTNPTGEPLDPSAHWQYLEPQSEVEFLWDGVDNIGVWNRKQSAQYAQRVSGSFGDEPVAVADGFYAWNDSSTSLLTQIGDDVANNYRTSGDIREAGFPFFTVGKYGKFYVKIEVWNDDLALQDSQTSEGATVAPRIVSSEALDGTFNTTTEAYIWTHLGEPNQIDISIEEWDADKNGVSNPGEYSLGDQGDGWVTLGTSDDAIIRNGKPVRFSFNPRPRPGILFGENNDYTSARLTRQAHLQTTVFDQFWTFYNRPWQNVFHENGSHTEKRLTSRMFHNNDHTLQWQDTGLRNGAEIKNFTWVFEPSYFKKDFGKGYEESLKYGDYQQLEALPGHQDSRLGGAHVDEEAYLTLAFMNYLFYFSAYSMDRSGRRQWMLNREFIDKTKIVTDDWRSATYATKPEYAVDHELKSADLYLKRSIFVREWRDDHWVSGGARTPLSPVNPAHEGTGGIVDAYELDWVQFPVTDLDLESATLVDVGAGAEHLDQWLNAYATNGSQVNLDIRARNEDNTSRSTVDGVASNYILPNAFNSWGFNRGSQVSEWYKPSPKRDFHPYWTQAMPDWYSPYTLYFVAADRDGGDLPGWSGPQVSSLSYHSVFTIPSSMIVERLRDPKGQDNWFGYAFDNGLADHGARLEQSTGGWAENENRAALVSAFDYNRQDQLNRYEHFRGLWGRGRYEARDHTFANWEELSRIRYGSRQNVKPSGVYYMNLGRYADFVTATAHKEHVTEFQHYTRGVSDWYYIRFQHEYVWYHDRHFPVTGGGTSRYDKFRDEYTNAQELIGIEWFAVSATPDIARFYYDPGAWVGWKDDIPITGGTKWVDAWEDTAHRSLRWYDAAYRSLATTYVANSIPIYWGPGAIGNVDRSFASGGYNYSTQTSSLTSYIDTGLDPTEGPTDTYIRRNIFDNSTGYYGLFNLAVGPEVPESREIYMNLVLPTELSV